MGSFGSNRQLSAGRRAKTPGMIVRRNREIICSGFAATCGGAAARYSLAWTFVVSHPFAKNANGWGTRPPAVGPSLAFRSHGHLWSPTHSPRTRMDGAPDHLRWGSRSLFACTGICGLPPIRQEREWMGHPAERQYEIGDSAPYRDGRIGLAWVVRMESVRIAKND